MILFARGIGGQIAKVPHQAINGIGIDEHTSLAQVDKIIDKKYCLQGNLDPQSLIADDISEIVSATYSQVPKDRPYVFNLGHGVLPWVCPDKVAQLIRTLRYE